jgi:N-acyl-D-aspartate/D-glutamate deacylase
VRIDDFSLRATPYAGAGNASVRTDLTLRPGEKVVVGTSSLGDRGLAVVVSASIVK